MCFIDCYASFLVTLPTSNIQTVTKKNYKSLHSWYLAGVRTWTVRTIMDRLSCTKLLGHCLPTVLTKYFLTKQACLQQKPENAPTLLFSFWLFVFPHLIQHLQHLNYTLVYFERSAATLDAHLWQFSSCVVFLIDWFLLLISKNVLHLSVLKSILASLYQVCMYLYRYQERPIC